MIKIISFQKLNTIFFTSVPVLHILLTILGPTSLMTKLINIVGLWTDISLYSTLFKIVPTIFQSFQVNRHFCAEN